MRAIPSILLFSFPLVFRAFSASLACLHSMKPCHLTSILTTNFFHMTFQLTNLVHWNSRSLVTFYIIGSCFLLKAFFSLDFETSPTRLLCLPLLLGAFLTCLVATLSRLSTQTCHDPCASHFSLYPLSEESHYWSDNTLPLSEIFNGLILPAYKYKYKLPRLASRFHTTHFESTLLDFSPIVLLYIPGNCWLIAK